MYIDIVLDSQLPSAQLKELGLLAEHHGIHAVWCASYLDGRDPFGNLAELAHEPFIMYSATDGAGLHASAMMACESAGFVPNVAQEATQVPTVLALVESGLGVALVPEVMRGYRSPKVVYPEIPDTATPETTLALAWIAGNESPAAQRFIEWAAGGAGALA